MQLVGKTKDNGLKVVSGVFKLFDTSGLPLTDLFEYLKQNNFIPSWNHFYEEAKKSGWKDKTIFSRLSEALEDVYGLEFKNIVLERLK